MGDAVPTTARRRRPIDTGGPWGTGLLLFGLGALAQGLGYLASSPGSLPNALETFGDTVPIRVWSLLWIAAGLWSVGKALRPPQQHRDVWPLVGMTSLWSAVYAVQWVISWLAYDHLTRAWSSSVAWAMVASVLITWGRCVNPPRTGR